MEFFIFTSYFILMITKLGGILTGLLSDILHARAVSCTFTLLLAIPSVSSEFCFHSKDGFVI